jgi:hypothetical protein
MMIGTPADIIKYTRAVQILLNGYGGYKKGKRVETDKQIRDEIVRTTIRVRQHMQNIHDRSVDDDNLNIVRNARACMQEIDALIEDVDKSSSGTQNAFFSGQRTVSNKDLKALIVHDHEVIEMVTNAVNLSNDSERAQQHGSDELASVIQRCQQMISSCRGFYSQRSTLLNGLNS